MIIFCPEPIQTASYASKLFNLLPFINSIITTHNSDSLLSEPTVQKSEKGQTSISNFLRTIKNYLFSKADSRIDEGQGYTSKNLQQVIRCVEDYKNNLNPMINLGRSSNNMKEMKKKKQFLRSRYQMILQKEENKERKQNRKICEQEIVYSKQIYQTKKKERLNFGNSIKTAKIKQYSKSRKEIQQECINLVDLTSKPFLQKQRGTIWRNISKENSLIEQENQEANNRIEINQQAVQNKQGKQTRNQHVLISKQRDSSEHDEQKGEALSSKSQSSPINLSSKQYHGTKEEDKKAKNDDNQIKNLNNPFLTKTSGRLNLSAIISGNFSLPPSSDISSVASNSHIQLTSNQSRQQQQQQPQQQQSKLVFNSSSISNGQIPQNMGTYTPFMNHHQNQTLNNNFAPQTQLHMVQQQQQHAVHNFGPAYGTNNEEFNRNAIAMFFGQNNKPESQGIFNGIEKTNKKSKVSKKPKTQPRIS